MDVPGSAAGPVTNQAVGLEEKVHRPPAAGHNAPMPTSPAEIDTFSYADPSDPRLKRFFIRLVERITGQPYLKYLYEDNRAHPVPGEDFWDAAVRKLELHLKYNEDALAKWPRTGPLVVVANHPFGVLDG